MPKVPFGNSFYCRQHWIVVPVGPNRTRLQVSFEVVYVTPCMFKKELTAGLTEGARLSFQAYRAHLLEHVPIVVTLSRLLQKASSGILLPATVHRARTNISLVLVVWYLLPLFRMLFMLFKKNEVAGLLKQAEGHAMGVHQLFNTQLAKTNGFIPSAADIQSFLSGAAQAAGQRVQATRSVAEQLASTAAALTAQGGLETAAQAAAIAQHNAAPVMAWAHNATAWLVSTAKTLAARAAG